MLVESHNRVDLVTHCCLLVLVLGTFRDALVQDSVYGGLAHNITVMP